MIRPRSNGRYLVALYIKGKERTAGTFDQKGAAIANGRCEDAKEDISRLPELQIDEALRSVARGEDISEAAGRTINAYADHFIDTIKPPKYAEGTKRLYEDMLKPLRADFGELDLADLDRMNAKRWAVARSRGNSRVARNMFNRAIEDELIRVNPFDNLRLETPRGRKDITAITEDELIEIADKATSTFKQNVPGIMADYGQVFRAVILTAGYAGPRLSEVASLEWGDLDAKRQEVTIRSGKGGKARIIVLPPAALEAIQALPRHITSERIFPSKRGKKLTKGTIGEYWRTVRGAWGRPETTFHELRHCAATLMLKKGVSHADVAHQLGHSDGGRLVMELYGHPSEIDARRNIRAAFGQNVARLKKVADGAGRGG